MSNGLRHTDKVAKYHVFDHNGLDHLHWFAVAIEYGEKMVLAGWVIEKKTCMKSCSCPDLNTNVENKVKQINIKQLIMVFK